VLDHGPTPAGWRSYRELFAGFYAGAEPALRTFPNTEGYGEIVSVTEIPFHSLCAHHFLPFYGTAHVAYVPKDRLVGLSKLARVVDFFARRPQLQERMTEQIAGLVEERVRPAGTMVMVQARHMCMEMRGVGKLGQTTTTTATRGVLQHDRWRRTFLSLLPPPTRASRPQLAGATGGLTLPTRSSLGFVEGLMGAGALPCGNSSLRFSLIF
jgi:GTP cyclohydrolase I